MTEQNLVKLLGSADEKNFLLGIEMLQSQSLWDKLALGFEQLTFFQKLRNCLQFDDKKKEESIYEAYQAQDYVKVAKLLLQIHKHSPMLLQHLDWMNYNPSKKYLVCRREYDIIDIFEGATPEEAFQNSIDEYFDKQDEKDIFEALNDTGHHWMAMENYSQDSDIEPVLYLMKKHGLEQYEFVCSVICLPPVHDVYCFICQLF